MAYSSPRTWTPGTIVTDVMLNTDIRDQFLALFGTTGIMVSGTHMVGPIIDTGGLTVSAGNIGIGTAPGTPHLTLVGQQGGVAKTITWTDLGAGITSILGNTVGGAPLSNVLRFDIATGTSGASATALTLDGSGGMKSGAGTVSLGGGDVVLGNGTGMANGATAGYVYIAGGGGAATGVPGNNANGFAIRYNTSSNTIQVYNGAWRSTAALT